MPPSTNQFMMARKVSLSNENPFPNSLVSNIDDSFPAHDYDPQYIFNHAQ